MSQPYSNRIVHCRSRGRTPLRVFESTGEGSRASMKHMKRGQQMYLIKRVATVFSDRQTSFKGFACSVAATAHEHQRDPKSRLKFHLLVPAAGRRRDGSNRAVRPAMTFSEQ